MWIVSVLFAISATTGAWYAWRRNPLYSGSKTVKWILIFLAGVSLFIAGSLGLEQILKGTHASDGVSFTVLIAYSLGIALAVCLFAIKANAPALTSLPASAPILHTNRHALRRWFKPFLLFNVALAVVTLALFAARLSWWYAFLVPGGLLDGIAVFMLLIAWYQAGIADRTLTDLQLNPWFAWRFTSAQWQAWVTTDAATREAAQAAAPVAKTQWKNLIPAFIIIPGGLLLMLHAQPMLLLIAFAVIVVFLGIILLFSRRSLAGTTATRRKKLLAAPPNVFFGPTGLFAEGDFTPWLTMSSFLTDAWLTPASVVFRFNKQVPSRTGNSTVIEEKSAPLPTNPAADLQLLQSHLAALCPQAHIALS